MICTCGHSAEAHADTHKDDIPGGPCIVQGCICKKWKRKWTEEEATKLVSKLEEATGAKW